MPIPEEKDKTQTPPVGDEGSEATPTPQPEKADPERVVELLKDELGLTDEEIKVPEGLVESIRDKIWLEIYTALTTTEEGRERLREMYEAIYPKASPEETKEKVEETAETIPDEILTNAQKLEGKIREIVKEALEAERQKSEEKQMAEEIYTELSEIKKAYPQIPPSVIEGLLYRWVRTGESPKDIFRREILPFIPRKSESISELKEAEKKETPPETGGSGAPISPGEKKSTLEELERVRKKLIEQGFISG